MKMKKANTKMMKEINKNTIRSCFREELESTVANLSQKTCLSVVTINALLKEMVETREVLVGQCIPSNGGRPSTVYKYNEMFKCAAIVFGFIKDNQIYIRVLITNLLGKCIFKEEIPMDNVNDNSFDYILDILFEKYKNIEVIAFGLPGQEENGEIIINDYEDIVGDTFLKHYKERYNVPVIFVNDINAAVNGYYHNKLENNQIESVVGIVFDRVHLPGAGIVIKGEIYTGKSNFAGEIGYMPIGIDWLNINYDDNDQVCKSIGKLLPIISCVVAPDSFIVYGDFFKENSCGKIKEVSKDMIQNKFNMDLVLSNKFEEDYELGMIKIAQESLKASEQVFNI